MAATSTVTAYEAAAAAPAPVLRNPKDSMKSTWRSWERNQWNHNHWIYEILNLHPTDKDREVPKHAKTDKMPYIAPWQGHKWIIAHAAWPLVIHQLYIWIMGKNMPLWAAIIYYMVVFKANAIHEIHRLRELGHRYGFLDGDKHDRDQVPDGRAGSVIHSLSLTATIRPMVSVFLAYRSAQTPISTLTFWVPVEVGLYTVVLDFYYYWYHRVLHESDTLWKFHRTHHLTKHPTVLLSLYADSVQEFFDIIGIPILTYLTLKSIGLPMGFSDWWFCQQYIVWTELWGHSGLRIFLTVPTPASPFLKLFDAELTTEDHDLHHRMGWKTSHNYGKQTRLWDRLFGTCFKRIEAIPENWDKSNSIDLPIFNFGGK